MDKTDLFKLIDRKIAKTYEDEKLFSNCYPNASDYYAGVRHGLKDAKQYIGMLNKSNNKIRT